MHIPKHENHVVGAVLIVSSGIELDYCCGTCGFFHVKDKTVWRTVMVS